MPDRIRDRCRRFLDWSSASQSVKPVSQDINTPDIQSLRRHGSPPYYRLAPRTDLPPYCTPVDISDPTVCMAAITNAISTAAVASHPAEVSTATDAVALVIKETAFFVARCPPAVAPAAASAITAAAANLANTSANNDPQKTVPTVEDCMASACSMVHIESHLPYRTFKYPDGLSDTAAPTFHAVWRVMRTVSSTSAPAVACALDSAVTSVTSAVAAAGGSGGHAGMQSAASAHADIAMRVARAFVESMAALRAVEQKYPGVKSPASVGVGHK
ncbi:hypothetical protein B0T25DRAFT_535527 [Lasiosphaeria hispida]|uniref:Uncharacterized protein n=1 Tax=Lasiosphaeria hispida TaxID=260671 RepID=A0AAJ0HS46_9PEZI|nr:hypothetical protein B0T25DRAFT_535527 [Lasiosphaeria hispida]